jgi:hypothetical protein
MMILILWVLLAVELAHFLSPIDAILLSLRNSKLLERESDAIMTIGHRLASDKVRRVSPTADRTANARPTKVSAR